MKLLRPATFALFVACQLCFIANASAFQLADAAPPAPGTESRFIFYWGKFQCNLSEANNYHGSLQLTVSDFRQIMLGPPKVWDGKALNSWLKFNLEGFAVSADTYLNQLAKMDAWLTPKLKPGQTIRLDGMSLTAGIEGVISFELQDEEKSPTPTLFGNSPRQLSNYVNDNMVEHVSWGRDDIMETFNRDFFTIREVWQTLRQEPAVTWPGTTSVPLRATVAFVSPNRTSYSVVSELEKEPYSQFLNSLELFSYMVQAGSMVTLSLETAAQYELIYKKTLRVVADNDPRLRLRRFRDLHRLSFNWGVWHEDLGSLYLHDQVMADGRRVQSDQPVASSTTVSFGEKSDSLPEIFAGFTAPEFELDGDALTVPYSFRISVGDSLEMNLNHADYSPEKIRDFFSKVEQGAWIQLDSMQIEGLDLPGIKIMILPVLLNNLLAKNDLGTLQKLADKGARVRLHDPVLKSNSLVFDFELNGKQKAALTIFSPDGWNDYVNTDVFSTGKQSIEVPLGAFKDKGKHFAFLNTPFGVSMVEFEVP